MDDEGVAAELLAQPQFGYRGDVILHVPIPRPPGAAGVMRKWTTLDPGSGRLAQHEQPYLLASPPTA